jgi:hypothetical protein
MAIGMKKSTHEKMPNSFKKNSLNLILQNDFTDAEQIQGSLINLSQ